MELLGQVIFLILMVSTRGIIAHLSAIAKSSKSS